MTLRFKAVECGRCAVECSYAPPSADHHPTTSNMHPPYPGDHQVRTSTKHPSKPNRPSCLSITKPANHILQNSHAPHILHLHQHEKIPGTCIKNGKHLETRPILQHLMVHSGAYRNSNTPHGITDQQRTMRKVHCMLEETRTSRIPYLSRISLYILY